MNPSLSIFIGQNIQK